MTKTPTFLFLALSTSPDSSRTELLTHSTSPCGPWISIADAVECSLDFSPSSLRPSFPQLPVVLADHSWDLHQKLPSAEGSCLTPGEAPLWGCSHPMNGWMWRLLRFRSALKSRSTSDAWYAAFDMVDKIFSISVRKEAQGLEAFHIHKEWTTADITVLSWAMLTLCPLS